MADKASYKSWKQTPLRFPKKAIIVLDNQGSRAALCAGKIIQTFSCQAARATDELGFIKLLQQAQTEQCEITGIVADNGMEVHGSDIIDGFASGYYSQYYWPQKNASAAATAYLIITGDQNLNYWGEAGARKTQVFSIDAWRKFLKDPSDSALGAVIGAWLGIEDAASKHRFIDQQMETTRAFGRKGVEDVLEARRGGHDNDTLYLKLSKARAARPSSP